MDFGKAKLSSGQKYFPPNREPDIRTAGMHCSDYIRYQDVTSKLTHLDFLRIIWLKMVLIEEYKNLNNFLKSFYKIALI
jgi:hypothetical protein